MLFISLEYSNVRGGPLESQKFGSYMSDFKNLHVCYSNYKVPSGVSYMWTSAILIMHIKEILYVSFHYIKLFFLRHIEYENEP